MSDPPTRSGMPRPCSVADISELILDKGLVVDAHAVGALVGLELVTVDARVVIASLDTALRCAEAVNRLDAVPVRMERTDPTN